MARSRLLIVSLIVGAFLLGVPIATPRKPTAPETVDRTMELAHGVTLHPTAASGVITQRPSVKLPIRANMIAVSFKTDATDPSRAEDGITVEARFHSASGWSDWDDMPIEAEDGPDDSSTEGKRAVDRVFAGPTWVGLVDKMAVRLIAHAGAPAAWDVRAHAYNTMGDAKPPTLIQKITGAVSRVVRGSQAEAIPSTPRILTRRQWGADERWREKDCCPRYAPQVQMMFIHHTAGSNSYSRAQSAAVVRGIYRFHTKTRHFSDIAYNFLVDRFGQIYEGRYGGMDRPVIGAHVKGFNTGSSGVSLMGTFTSANPSSSMITSLKYLLAWKMDVHHIPAVGSVVMTSLGNPKFAKGRHVRFARISGHTNAQYTACPGKRVYRLLPAIRDSVSKIGAPKIYLPGLDSSLLRPNGDTANETITVTAGFSQSVAWAVEFRSYSTGTMLKRFTGTGTSTSVKWDGKDAGGNLSDTGKVLYTITARTPSHTARAVAGTLNIVNKHPDGTVLRSPTQTVVIDDGKARSVPSTLVFNSWYRAAELVATTDVEIARYASGSPIALREGTILVEPDGTFSIISDGVRRPFGPGVFAALGYTAASALPIDATELATLTSGPQIDDATGHPQGAVVRASNGGVWTIGDGSRSVTSTMTMLRSRYHEAEVVTATEADLSLPVSTPLSYRDGTLFRLADGTYWIFNEGKRRRFYHSGLYAGMGYQSAGALAMSTSEANSIPQGLQII